jgi:hypothetical protein
MLNALTSFSEILALTLPGALPAQIQPFFAVKTIDPLMVNLPAFTLEKDMDPLVAISDPNCGNLSDSHPQLGLTVCAAMVSVT